MNKKLITLIIFILLVAGAVYLYKSQYMGGEAQPEDNGVGVNISVGEGGEIEEAGSASDLNISIGEPKDNDASVNISVGEASE